MLSPIIQSSPTSFLVSSLDPCQIKSSGRAETYENSSRQNRSRRAILESFLSSSNTQPDAGRRSANHTQVLAVRNFLQATFFAGSPTPSLSYLPHPLDISISDTLVLTCAPEALPCLWHVISHISASVQ